MNGLLFSLPGTPVIYYGDEIGMGDNVYLGDRNGVRTPMQWSNDRNAGFSTANRQRLYLPVVTDPEYHYEAVNVDAQQSNPQSLLWWMKRVIALRKKHPAFGRGSLQFLHPGNRRILAFIREYGDETLLVVANLSRYAQWTELPLDAYEGRVPVELFGAIEFPRIGAAPYLLSLGPHSFLWFRLVPDPTAVEPPTREGELPELPWRGGLSGLLKRPGDEVTDALVAWMLTQRWYRGAALKVQSARIVEVVAIPLLRHALLVLLQVQYRHAESVTYVLPLTTDQDADIADPLATSPGAAIARLVGSGPVVHLLDGSQVPAVFEALLRIVTGQRHVSAGTGELVGQRRDGLRAHMGTAEKALRASPLGDHLVMSNSSASFSDRLVMKLYRVLEDGPNPDLEVGSFLADRGFANVARVLGSIEVDRGPRSAATLAMVQAFVPNEGSLWEATREAVRRVPPRRRGRSGRRRSWSPTTSTSSWTSRAANRRSGHGRLLGASLVMAGALGERVGEMHTVLASADPADPAFGPEPMSAHHVRSLYQSIRRRVGEALELLEARRASLPPRDAEAARAVLEAAPRVEALLARLRDIDNAGQRIRVHGDLHLGHVLDTGSNVVIIDFEGDSARPLSERRLKRPALTDLASLVRSFHFAAHWPRVERELLGGGEATPDGLASWSTFWFQWMSAACIQGYRSVTEGAAFAPGDDVAWSVLFKCLLVSRACDELTSRLGTRSDWLGIPLAGLDELLGGTE